MKKLLLLLVLGGFAGSANAQTPTVFDDPELVQRYQATITPAEIAGQLYFYASDYLEGRETATRGQQIAALYLAGQHQSMGLEPRGTADTAGPHDPAAFLQPFDLNEEVVRSATLTAMRGSQSVATTMYGTEGMDGHSYFSFGADAPVSAGVVFAGHGVQTESFDDFAAMSEAGIDFSGKWLVFLDAEPMTVDGNSLVSESGDLTSYTTSGFQKIRAVLQSGAGMPAGFLFVGDTDPRGAESIATRAAARLNTMGSLSLPGSEDGGGRQLPPIFTVSSEFASDLVGQSVTELRDQIAESQEPNVFEVEGLVLSSNIEKGVDVVRAENVAAFIEGSDPELKDEVIVISAHLDHIGMTSSGEDRISNGADDDGSGTIALLEIAEAFQYAKSMGHGPRRSILFLHVTGEEKGLLGSAYYADVEPLLPLENTVANLNIDMIGRHDPEHPGGGENYVYIIGAELISTDIDEINTRVNTDTGLDIELSKRFNSPDDPNQFFRRSDHWNFGKHDIPFIFYFTGTHEDYHQVGDEAWKIDYDHLAKITRLVFGTAWQIANQDARPAVSGAGFN